MFGSKIPSPKYRLVQHIVPVFGRAVDSREYWTIEKRMWFGIWQTLGESDDPYCDHSRFDTKQEAEEMLAYFQRKPMKKVVCEYYD